jgi:hypothetical protein
MVAISPHRPVLASKHRSLRRRCSARNVAVAEPNSSTRAAHVFSNTSALGPNVCVAEHSCQGVAVHKLTPMYTKANYKCESQPARRSRLYLQGDHKDIFKV